MVAVAMLLVPAIAVLVVRESVPPPPALPTASAISMAPPQPASVDDLTPEIRGKILDADGNPVPGAEVRVVSPRPPYTTHREAKTDAAGAFSFPHLAEQPVRVVADHDPEGAVTSAELEPEQGRTKDVVLVLSAAGSVTGSVVDGEDHPVAGAAVTVEGAPWAVRRATSDEAGAFRLPAVPEEARALVVVARGYRTARVALSHGDEPVDLVVRVKLDAADPVDGEVRDDDGQPVAARIVACEGQPSEARVESGNDGTFRLPATAIGCDAVAARDDSAPSDAEPVVEGSLLRLRLKAGGAIEGVVVDARGEAVPAYRLGIESFATTGGRARGASGARSFEDSRGSFRWDKLVPGSYVLTVSAPGKPPTRSDAIEVSAGVATRNVRIVLQEGGVVTGHVFDDHHAPLAGVALRFDLVSSVVDSNAASTTDDSGAYRLEGAPAGPFTLRAQKDGFRMRLVSGLRVPSGGTLALDVTLSAVDGRGGMELGGIGATLTQTHEGIALGGVFPGDPADRAGLHTGDRILRIDGEDTSDMSVADAIQRLRGDAGTSVGVSVQRPSTGETIDVVVVRGTIVH